MSCRRMARPLAPNLQIYWVVKVFIMVKRVCTNYKKKICSGNCKYGKIACKYSRTKIICTARKVIKKAKNYKLKCVVDILLSKTFIYNSYIHRRYQTLIHVEWEQHPVIRLPDHPVRPAIATDIRIIPSMHQDWIQGRMGLKYHPVIRLPEIR